MRKLILAVVVGLMVVAPASAAMAGTSEDVCNILRPWCG